MPRGYPRSKPKKSNRRNYIYDNTIIPEQPQDIEEVRKFWLTLTDVDKQDILKINKRDLLRKVKEQHRPICSCNVCGRKRTLIDKEVERLYELYCDELESVEQYDENEEEFEDDVSEVGENASEEFIGWSFGKNLIVRNNHISVNPACFGTTDNLLLFEMIERLSEVDCSDGLGLGKTTQKTPENKQKDEKIYNPTEEHFSSEEFEEVEEFEEEEEEEEEDYAEEQVWRESKRMFRVYAAKLFRDRLLLAFYERRARLIQQELLAEEVRETRKAIKEKREQHKQVKKEIRSQEQKSQQQTAQTTKSSTSTPKNVQKQKKAPVPKVPTPDIPEFTQMKPLISNTASTKKKATEKPKKQKKQSCFDIPINNLDSMPLKAKKKGKEQKASESTIKTQNSSIKNTSVEASSNTESAIQRSNSILQVKENSTPDSCSIHTALMPSTPAVSVSSSCNKLCKPTIPESQNSSNRASMQCSLNSPNRTQPIPLNSVEWPTLGTTSATTKVKHFGNASPQSSLQSSNDEYHCSSQSNGATDSPFDTDSNCSTDLNSHLSPVIETRSPCKSGNNFSDGYVLQKNNNSQDVYHSNQNVSLTHPAFQNNYMNWYYYYPKVHFAYPTTTLFPPEDAPYVDKDLQDNLCSDQPQSHLNDQTSCYNSSMVANPSLYEVPGKCSLFQHNSSVCNTSVYMPPTEKESISVFDSAKSKSNCVGGYIDKKKNIWPMRTKNPIKKSPIGPVIDQNTPLNGVNGGTSLNPSYSDLFSSNFLSPLFDTANLFSASDLFDGLSFGRNKC